MKKLKIQKIFNNDEINKKAVELFNEERTKKRLDGWFIAQEISMHIKENNVNASEMMQAALCLEGIAEKLPLEISENNIFVATQRDAFARTYALINPEFRVENFTGYCDPCDVFHDIKPNEEFTKERIDTVLKRYKKTPYVSELIQASDEAHAYTEEAIFFFEQVTGHIIPNFKPLIKHGVPYLIEQIEKNKKNTEDPKKIDNYHAMQVALNAYMILANRYANLASELAKKASGKELDKYRLIEHTLKNAVVNGASDLYEALQLMLLAWQCMCVEQVANPYAFSLGNVDR